jgi:hypothetical protein
MHSGTPEIVGSAISDVPVRSRRQRVKGFLPLAETLGDAALDPANPRGSVCHPQSKRRIPKRSAPRSIITDIMIEAGISFEGRLLIIGILVRHRSFRVPALEVVTEGLSISALRMIM